MVPSTSKKINDFSIKFYAIEVYCKWKVLKVARKY